MFLNAFEGSGYVFGLCVVLLYLSGALRVIGMSSAPVSTSFPILLLTGPLQVFLEWNIYCGLVNFLWLHFSGLFDGMLRSVSIRQRPALNILTSSPVRPSDAHAHLLKKLHRVSGALSGLINPCGPDLYDLPHVRNWASLEPMTLPDKWSLSS